MDDVNTGPWHRWLGLPLPATVTFLDEPPSCLLQTGALLTTLLNSSGADPGGKEGRSPPGPAQQGSTGEGSWDGWGGVPGMDGEGIWGWMERGLRDGWGGVPGVDGEGPGNGWRRVSRVDGEGSRGWMEMVPGMDGWGGVQGMDGWRRSRGWMDGEGPGGGAAHRALTARQQGQGSAVGASVSQHNSNNHSWTTQTNKHRLDSPKTFLDYPKKPSPIAFLKEQP